MIRWLLLLGTPSLLLAQFSVAIVSPSGEERAIQGVEDLGSIPIGDTLDSPLRVRNTSASPVVLERLAVAGASFSVLNAPRTPQTVAAGGSADFLVRFSPL